jgi:hypothetical protein
MPEAAWLNECDQIAYLAQRQCPAQPEVRNCCHQAVRVLRLCKSRV